jgi:hypothetical protein
MVREVVRACRSIDARREAVRRIIILHGYSLRSSHAVLAMAVFHITIPINRI